MYPGERFNSISHLLGAALALAGMAVLITLGSIKGDAWKIVSFTIYGATLFVLYITSTLYHSLRGLPKSVFQILVSGDLQMYQNWRYENAGICHHFATRYEAPYDHVGRWKPKGTAYFMAGIRYEQNMIYRI